MAKARQRPARPAPDYAPPPPTSRPTPERRNQAARIDEPDVNGHSYRPGWRVETRLDLLLVAGKISPAAHEAACSLRHDAERVGRIDAARIARLGEAAAIRGAPDLHRTRITAVEATSRLRRARQRLGEAAYALVWHCVVLDQSWSEIGRRAGCHASTARNWCAEAIERLVE